MNLAIIGGGEMASELYNLVISCDKKNSYENIFFVDVLEKTEENYVLEADFLKTNRNSSELLIAMGEPSMRKKMAQKYEEEGFRLTTFIHPLSFISAGTVIGNGSIILPFTYVAQNTVIGENVLLHSGCKVENNCNIGNNCFISSNSFVGARVTVEDTCFIGPSASIRDGVSIGHDSIIGMGSVITKSVVENSVNYGNPAKQIRENSNHRVFN